MEKQDFKQWIMYTFICRSNGTKIRAFYEDSYHNVYNDAPKGVMAITHILDIDEMASLFSTCVEDLDSNESFETIILKMMQFDKDHDLGYKDYFEYFLSGSCPDLFVKPKDVNLGKEVAQHARLSEPGFLLKL